MSKRVCAEPGCPTLVDADTYRGRCITHKRAYNAALGTNAARGYGSPHQRERARWQAKINQGEAVQCWRCAAPIIGRAWHLGHDDHDRTITRGPECIPCNLSAAGKSRWGKATLT